MQTETVIDKSKWGPGEWQSEPDRVDFVHSGFACFARRHPGHGYWCGYVGVPREHPLYGKEWTETAAIGELEAHMGVNYSAVCDGGDICHTPAPGMPDDVWWLGFDCGHMFDLAPRMRALLAEALEAAKAVNAPWASALGLTEVDRMEVYRPLPYVRHEIERLAEQLAEMK